MVLERAKNRDTQLNKMAGTAFRNLCLGILRRLVTREGIPIGGFTGIGLASG